MAKLAHIALIALTLCLCILFTKGFDSDGNGVDDECEFATFSGGVSGDPHFVGFQGQRFDFHGTPYGVYTLVRDSRIQMNSRFHPDPRWEGKTVIGQIALMQNEKVAVEATCQKGALLVSVNGNEAETGAPMALLETGMAVLSKNRKTLLLHVSDFQMTIQTHKTRQLDCFLDVDVNYVVRDSTTLPTGILGETVSPHFSADDLEELEAAFRVADDNIYATNTAPTEQQGRALRTLLSETNAGESFESLVVGRKLQQLETCGCTDSFAANFDSSATLNDGSCYFYMLSGGGGTISSNSSEGVGPFDPSSTGSSSLVEVTFTGDCSSYTSPDELEYILHGITLETGVYPDEVDLLDYQCENGTELRVIFKVYTIGASGLFVMNQFVISNETLDAVPALTEISRSWIDVPASHPLWQRRLEPGTASGNSSGTYADPCMSDPCGNSNGCYVTAYNAYSCICLSVYGYTKDQGSGQCVLPSLSGAIEPTPVCAELCEVTVIHAEAENAVYGMARYEGRDFETVYRIDAPDGAPYPLTYDTARVSSLNVHNYAIDLVNNTFGTQPGVKFPTGGNAAAHFLFHNPEGAFNSSDWLLSMVVKPHLCAPGTGRGAIFSLNRQGFGWGQHWFVVMYDKADNTVHLTRPGGYVSDRLELPPNDSAIIMLSSSTASGSTVWTITANGQNASVPGYDFDDTTSFSTVRFGSRIHVYTSNLVGGTDFLSDMSLGAVILQMGAFTQEEVDSVYDALQTKYAVPDPSPNDGSLDIVGGQYAGCVA